MTVNDDCVEKIRHRWTDNGILAREGFPQGVLAYGHVMELLDEVERLRVRLARIEKLADALKDDSHWWPRDIADRLDRVLNGGSDDHS